MPLPSHTWFPRTTAGIAAMGLQASLLTHLAAAGAILFVPWHLLWNDWSSEPAELQGRKGVILIQVAFASTEPVEEPTEIAAADPPVLVMPSEARIEHYKLVSVPAAELAISQDLTDVLLAEPSAPAIPTPAAKPESQPVPHIPVHSNKVPRAASAPPMTVGFEEAASFAGNAPPQYPDEARNHGWTGTVLLRLWVDAAGQVTKVHVERSSGYGVLDASAVNAVKHWKGLPARRNGCPVATQELLPVEFRIPRR